MAFHLMVLILYSLRPKWCKNNLQKTRRKWKDYWPQLIVSSLLHVLTMLLKNDNVIILLVSDIEKTGLHEAFQLIYYADNIILIWIEKMSLMQFFLLKFGPNEKKLCLAKIKLRLRLWPSGRHTH